MAGLSHRDRGNVWAKAKRPVWACVLFLFVLWSIASVPVAKAAPGKSIVVIMTDDQDMDSLPVMRKLLAQPEGSWVRFAHAYTNHSLCCPARSTFLTGRYAHHNGVVDNDGAVFSDANTLPVWLNDAGYTTRLLGKYLNGYPWDRGAGYIPPGWDQFQVNVSDKQITQKAVTFIQTTSAPFFLYLAYHAPHEPAQPPAIYATADAYVPPDRSNYNEADVTDKPAWVRLLPVMSQAKQDQWHQERLDSQRALLGVDDNVQTIVDTLKAAGQLDNTLLIFLTDNGFSWGSHRHIGKRCVYEECANIPLFIRYPGALNRTEDRIVSNVSFASTITDWAGITPGLPQDGTSLTPLLDGTATVWGEDILQENQGDYAGRRFYGIRAPGWRYVEYTNGNRELYDLAADPYELTNHANDPAYASVQADLAARLAVLLEE